MTSLTAGFGSPDSISWREIHDAASKEHDRRATTLPVKVLYRVSSCRVIQWLHTLYAKAHSRWRPMQQATRGVLELDQSWTRARWFEARTQDIGPQGSGRCVRSTQSAIRMVGMQ